MRVVAKCCFSGPKISVATAACLTFSSQYIWYQRHLFFSLEMPRTFLHGGLFHLLVPLIVLNNFECARLIG